MSHWHGEAWWKIREQAERLGDDALVEPQAERVEHGVRHGRSSVAEDPAAVKQGVAEGIVALPADVADAVQIRARDVDGRCPGLRDAVVVAGGDVVLEAKCFQPCPGEVCQRQ